MDSNTTHECSITSIVCGVVLGLTNGSASGFSTSSWLRLVLLLGLLVAPSLSPVLGGFSGFVTAYMAWGALIALALPQVMGRRGSGSIGASGGVYLATLVLSIYVIVGIFIGFKLRHALLIAENLAIEACLLIVTVGGSEIARSLSMSFFRRYAIKILIGGIGGFLVFGMNYLQAYERLYEAFSNPLTTLDDLVFSILVTDIHVKGGFIPALSFRLIFDGFWRLSPIAPARVEGLAGAALESLVYYTAIVALNAVSRNPLERGLRRKSSGKILDLIGSSMMGAIALVLAVMIVLKLVPLVVTSGSMSPSINIGDIVLVSLEYEHVNVGDVIVFYDEYLGALITHRVVDVTSEGYITKGDANPQADPAIVERDAILGKVVLTIPALGWIVVFARHAGTLLAQSELVLVTLALLVVALMAYIATRDDSPRKLIKPREMRLRGG